MQYVWKVAAVIALLLTAGCAGFDLRHGSLPPAQYPYEREVHPLGWWSALRWYSGGVEDATGHITRRDSTTRRLYVMRYVPSPRASEMYCQRRSIGNLWYMDCIPNHHFGRPYCAEYADRRRCNDGSWWHRHHHNDHRYFKKPKRKPHW